jgi:hypothetical protein
VASSKLWKAGRWYWYCIEQNRTMDWRDHWECGSTSRLTYSTEQEANRAASTHEARNKGHAVRVAKIPRK